jgi:hypothetical protein
MYNPIAISQYGQMRHQELVREAEAYWQARLVREGGEAGSVQSGPSRRLGRRQAGRLLTALLR